MESCRADGGGLVSLTDGRSGVDTPVVRRHKNLGGIGDSDKDASPAHRIRQKCLCSALWLTKTTCHELLWTYSG